MNTNEHCKIHGIARCTICIPVKCERCERNDPSDVPHDNCMYGGRAIGHSAAHCTANACF